MAVLSIFSGPLSLPILVTLGRLDWRRRAYFAFASRSAAECLACAEPSEEIVVESGDPDVRLIRGELAALPGAARNGKIAVSNLRDRTGLQHGTGVSIAKYPGLGCKADIAGIYRQLRIVGRVGVGNFRRFCFQNGYLLGIGFRSGFMAVAFRSDQGSSNGKQAQAWFDRLGNGWGGDDVSCAAHCRECG